MCAPSSLIYLPSACAVVPCPAQPPPPPPPKPPPKLCGDGFVFISVDDADDWGHADYPNSQGDLYPYVVKYAITNTTNPKGKGVVAVVGSPTGASAK